VAVSKSEQVPEDAQLRMKHVAVDRNFNVILNYREIVNRVIVQMHRVIHQWNRMLKCNVNNEHEN
jgi:hypothetical protein